LCFQISDPKDIFIIEEPFETYDNNSNPDESIQLENDILLESRNYYLFLAFFAINS
jgi:hypothetical protein